MFVWKYLHIYFSVYNRLLFDIIFNIILCLLVFLMCSYKEERCQETFDGGKKMVCMGNWEVVIVIT